MLNKWFRCTHSALGTLSLFLAASVLMLLNLTYAGAGDHSPDWSQTEWEEHLTLEMVDNNQVGRVGFSPDGSLIFATPGSDVVVWDSTTGDEISRFKHERGTSNAAFSPDNSRLITTSGYRLARIWDIQSQELLFTFGDESHQMRPAIDFVAWPPQGPRAAYPVEGWALKVFDALNKELVTRLDDISTRTVQLVFSPDGTRIAAALSDGTIRIFDADSAEQLLVHDRHEGEPEIAFSNDGTRMVSVGRDSTMEVWDTATGEVIQRWEEQFSNSWQSPKFSPDDRWIIVISKNSWDRFQILDIASGEKVAALPRGESGKPQYNPRFVQFAPDGQSIMTADLQSIRIWYPEALQDQVPVQTETTEVAQELQQLQEQGNLTVRALGAYGLLPEGFMQTAMALRGQGMDLLSADREELQDWLNRSQQGQMDLQLHEKDMLKELVSIMTLEGETEVSPDASTATEPHDRTSLETKQAEREMASKSFPEPAPKARAQKEYTALGISFQAPERLTVITDEQNEFVLGDPDWERMLSDYRFDEPLGMMIAVGIEQHSNLGFLNDDHVEQLPETVMLGNKTFEQYLARESMEYEQREAHAAGYVLLARTPSKGGQYLVLMVTYVGQSAEDALQQVKEVAGSFKAVKPAAFTDEIPITAGLDSMLHMRIPQGMVRNWDRSDYFRIQTYNSPYSYFQIKTHEYAREDMQRELRNAPEDSIVSRKTFQNYSIIDIQRHSEDWLFERKIFERCLPEGEPIVMTFNFKPEFSKEIGGLEKFLKNLELSLPADMDYCARDVLEPLKTHLGLQ